jgi:phage shock protein E
VYATAGGPGFARDRPVVSAARALAAVGLSSTSPLWRMCLHYMLAQEYSERGFTPDPHRHMPRFRNLPIDIVLDVRNKLEFWLGHLDGAECVPVSDLPEALERRPEIAKDARILVYCAGGVRSAAAAAALRGAGYTRVVDGGGMSSASAEYEA